MIIESKEYGRVNVDEKQILHFEKGLLGFENIKDYALLDASQPPFMWLQSIEVAHLAFILLDPTIFREDYDPKIADDELEELGLKDDNIEDRLVLSIITIPENHNDMTANLQGPIIINKEKCLGRQFISPDDRWTTKHHVMNELAGKRAATC